jgi:hypothetical protein
VFRACGATLAELRSPRSVAPGSLREDQWKNAPESPDENGPETGAAPTPALGGRHLRGARAPRAARLKRRPERVAYLDNLKLLLVAVIIAGHGALAYGDLENAWPYQDVREVHLAGVSNITLAMVVIPAALFAMGLFFLISGLVTPGSVSRKGPRTFARDRLLRLGAPLVVWTLVIWPGAIWAAHLAAGETHSFWWQLRHADPVLDTGPMWFVEVLLIYSLAYAAWRYWRRRQAARPDRIAASNRSAPLSARTLVALAAAISVATVLVRPVFPAASGQIGQSHLWQWPQLVVMFGLGSSPPSAAGSIRCLIGFAAGAAWRRWAGSRHSWSSPGSWRRSAWIVESSSTPGSTGPLYPSPRSRVRSPLVRRCGCSASPNNASILARVRSVAPWRAAPTARSSYRGSCSLG